MEKSLTSQPEPHRLASTCAYCGDAPINHTLFYIASLPAMLFDAHILKVTQHAPDFLRDFVDWLLYSFFELSLFFGMAKLSDDIDKATTFRSRVIWEEARRRGIEMRQVVMFGRPIDQYRVMRGGKVEYFNSLPIPQKLLTMRKNWDDKFVLKEEFIKNNIPIPAYTQFATFSAPNLEEIFSTFKMPIIVKPRVGSRGRHTVTNIHTLEDFRKGVNIAKQICSYLVAEEHMEGDVCRATLVRGKLMGFYRGSTPFVMGDGVHTVAELITEKDINRPHRVERILVNDEVKNYVLRAGFKMNDIVPLGMRLPLTHRTGRLAGGITREMLDELHPSFVPILEKAGAVVGLPVMGFDVIVPDPLRDADTQRWGIIECNTLPFIDLHYYALEGKPKNIAGAIWDVWQASARQ